ncbi:MAG: diguanylate cyclase [Pseudomonadota bacterium]
MTLRKKTLIAFGVTCVALVAVVYLTSRAILVGGFVQTEEKAELENMNRLLGSVEQCIKDFDVPAADWANWNDIYFYMKDHNKEFAEANLTSSCLANLKINALLVANTAGRVVFEMGYDLENGNIRAVPRGIHSFLKTDKLLNPQSKSGFQGLILLPQGPMIVSARQILTTNGEGPSRGTLIFGRFLDRNILARFARVTRLRLSSHAVNSARMPKDVKAIYSTFLQRPETIAVRSMMDPRISAGYLLLPDLWQEPCVVLRAQMSRSFYMEGLATLRYFILKLVVVAITFGLVTAVMLEKGILSRLAQLSGNVSHIGLSSDLSARIAVAGTDELSTLASSVNAMLASLERSQERLKHSEERFRSVAQTANDAIISADSRGNIIFWNDAAQNIFGYSAQEAVGRETSFIVPEQYQTAHQKGIERLISTGKSKVLGSRVELIGLRKDGTQFPIDLSLARWQTKDGVFFTGVVRDITERRHAEERLKYLSLHDPLTGLYSRAYFEQEMRRLQSGRQGSVGVIFCDVDGLKLVNDTLGHAAGDSLLMAAANAIHKCFRKGDMVARIGGDEFAILLAKRDTAAVEYLASRIRASVVSYNAANANLPLSMSVGTASTSDPSVSLSDLCKEADNNMYREKLHRSRSARSAIVQTLMKTLEARDDLNEGRSKRVQALTSRLALAAGIPERELPDLSLLAKFCDIGKVGVSDSILRKTGPLTPEEATEMRRHCEIGYRIAQSAPDLAPIADWILKHHEWWNGAGYPTGLKQEDIPLECRVLAVTSAYDALTSDRPFRKALTHEEAMAELRKCAGTQFDPAVMEKFETAVLDDPAERCAGQCTLKEEDVCGNGNASRL